MLIIQFLTIAPVLAELTTDEFDCKIWLGDGNRYYDLTELQRSAKASPLTPYYMLQGFKTERILFNFCSVIDVTEITNSEMRLSCARFQSNATYAYLIGHGNERTQDGQLVPKCDALSGSPADGNAKVQFKEYYYSEGEDDGDQDGLEGEEEDGVEIWLQGSRDRLTLGNYLLESDLIV